MATFETQNTTSSLQIKAIAQKQRKKMRLVGDKDVYQVGLAVPSGPVILLFTLNSAVEILKAR